MSVKPNASRDVGREGVRALFVAGNILIARAFASDFHAAPGAPGTP